MLLTVGEFRDQVDSGIGDLVERLQRVTGRSGDEETEAWRASLPKFAEALAAPALAPLHLFFSGAGSLALEYQLPAASSWCDVILLGRRDDRPGVLMIELKDWITRGDAPGPYEGLMVRHGSVTLHPSDQVRGYVEYCRRFHSTVQEVGARVSGCVLFTRDHVANTYVQEPNERLATEYPCFTVAPETVKQTLAAFFTEHVTDPDPGFATAFVKGRYRQDRGFVRQIGEQILTPDSSPFELLDNQRRAFAIVQARLEGALFTEAGFRKQVILIHGPPGSGKSVLAAKIWATLVADERLPEGSVVLTTTSTSQTSNWTSLFRRAGNSHAAGGVVKRAASYMPVSTQEVGRLRRRHGSEFLKSAAKWRENVELLRDMGVQFQDGARDQQHLISVVDEAHALINPEHPEGRGQFGFAPTLGPLAWHIIRASTVSIFLLDAAQGFRDRENTTADDIEDWGRELGAGVMDGISLEGAQFRCAGSAEYVDWVEAMLQGDPPEQVRVLAAAWHGILDVQVFQTPAALEGSLRDRLAEGRSARLLASYAREWKTRDAANPHAVPEEMMDFYELYRENGRRQRWSKVWNVIPRNGSDYTWFVQAPEGSPMHDDQLSEVGCPYAVRGFDFDYVGMLWLSDLKWRNDGWIVDTDHVFETGVTRTLRAARRETVEGPARAELRHALAQAYRILLTRSIYGTYLWFEDEETRQYVEACLEGPND